MAQQTLRDKTFECEGTPEELERFLKLQRPDQRFRLSRLSSEHEIDGVRYPSLSVQARIEAMDSLAEQNRNLPILPAAAFDREKLYEEVS